MNICLRQAINLRGKSDLNWKGSERTDIRVERSCAFPEEEASEVESQNREREEQ